MIQNSSIDQVANYLNGICFQFLGVFFLLGSIIELLSENDYKGLLFRTLIAILVLTSFKSFLFKSVEHSLVFSDQILKRFDKANPLILNLKSIDKKESENLKKRPWWERLKKMAKLLLSDQLSTIVWIFTYICLILLKNVYSVVFNLLHVFVGLMALLSMIRPTERALSGAFKTYLSLTLTPLVMTVILILMGHSLAIVKGGSGTLAEDLHALLQLFITSILLLFSPLFAGGITSGLGVHEASNKIAKIGAGAIMGSGISLFINGYKNLGKGGKWFGTNVISSGKKLSKFALKKTKEKLKTKSSQIREKHQILEKDNNPQEASPENLSQKIKMKNLGPTEKLILKTENLVSNKKINPTRTKAQTLILELNEGKNTLNTYTPKEKSMALKILERRPLVEKTNKNWIKDKKLYWMLYHEATKLEPSSKTTPPKKKKGKKKTIGKKNVSRPSKNR